MFVLKCKHHYRYIPSSSEFQSLSSLRKKAKEYFPSISDPFNILWKYGDHFWLLSTQSEFSKFLKIGNTIQKETLFLEFDDSLHFPYSATAETLLNSEEFKKCQGMNMKFPQNLCQEVKNGLNLLGNTTMLKTKTSCMEPESSDQEPFLAEGLEQAAEDIKNEAIPLLSSISARVTDLVESTMKASRKEEAVVHPNILCDGCNNIICGHRFKCYNCEDFDLCKSCKNKQGLHPSQHLFVEIKHPEEAKLLQQRPRGLLEKEPPKNDFTKQSNCPLSSVVIQAPSFPIKVVPNSSLRNVWIIRNNGPYKWPYGTTLECVLGFSKEYCRCDSVISVPDLSPEEQTTVTLSLKAPDKVGSYTSFWRLQTDQGEFFGEHLVFDISVEEYEPCDSDPKKEGKVVPIEVDKVQDDETKSDVVKVSPVPSPTEEISEDGFLLL